MKNSKKLTKAEIQEKIKVSGMAAFIVTLIIGGVLALLAVMAIVNGVVRLEKADWQTEFVIRTALSVFNYGFSSVVALLTAGLLYEIQKSYTPFAKKVGKYLAGISFLFSIMGLAVLVCGMIIDKIAPSFDTISEFVFPIVIAGIVFAVLARVFEYGRLLQQESDETL